VFLVIALALAVFVLPDRWDVPAVAIGAGIEITETAVSVWWSRRGAPKVGPETLLGATGRVVVACRPDGRVRVAGEVWNAHCEDGAEVDDLVRVIRREGLTLTVVRAEA
jgi:membrane-bound ClpP family serine protease